MNTFKMLFFVLFSTLCVISCTESSEPVDDSPGMLRGVIKNSSTNANIKDVFIYTIPWSFVDSSNVSGRFELNNLPAGEYFVFAQKDSFEVERQKTVIKNGQLKELVFNLRKTYHENSAPNIPFLKSPESSVSNIQDSVKLVWWAAKDVEGDPVFYDVYLDENGSPYTRIQEEISDTFCVVKNLESAKTYFWRVLASDKDKVSGLSSIYKFTTLGFKEYVVTLPEGKLPYPHHNPDYTEAEYNDMMENLWVIDNYGDYVADSTRSRLSSGFAIYVGENKPLYSITAGTVKSVQKQSVNGAHLVIEDYENPGYGWVYRFVKGITVSVGNLIPAGFKIGEVNNEYNGIYSIERAFSYSNNNWLRGDWVYKIPDEFFIYEDTKNPQISGIHFFVENTDIRFDGDLSGNIDIIVNIKDLGDYASEKLPLDPLFNNNVSVSKIEYSIKYDLTGEIIFSEIIDFRELNLNLTDQIYMPWQVGLKRDDLIKDFIYHKSLIISNFKRINGRAVLDNNFTWDTTELDAQGKRKYRNGMFIITVRVWDYRGNSATASAYKYVYN